MIYIIMSESFIKIEPLQHLSLSLGLINQRGQFFSGHVVRAENWGLDKNPQQWETSYAVVYEAKLSHFKV